MPLIMWVAQTTYFSCIETDLSSNALTNHSHFQREVFLTLKTLGSPSVPESRVPSTAGPLTSSLGRRTVATTSSRCGRYSCVIRRHRLPTAPIRKFGWGENSESAKAIISRKPIFQQLERQTRSTSAGSILQTDTFTSGYPASEIPVCLKAVAAACRLVSSYLLDSRYVAAAGWFACTCAWSATEIGTSHVV